MRVAIPLLVLLGSGCTNELCAHGEYGLSECRVAAQSYYAQLSSASGAVLRFQEPAALEATAWQALGRLAEDQADQVSVRPATLGDFALSIDPGTSQLTTLDLVVENLAADTVLSLGPLGAEVDLEGEGTRREVEVALGEDTLWLRGRRDCPITWRLAVAGDVQTNPVQFERILDALHQEVAEAEAAGEPLLGFALLGDLVESPSLPELEHLAGLVSSSPVPVSTTPGNHDVNGDSYALYNRVFGPGTLAQSLCGAHLALLDTANGDLAPSVQARLPELLDRGEAELLVAAGHYPVWPGRTGNGWGDEDAAWYLLSELVRNRAELYVAGHVHTWEEHEEISAGDGSLHQIISGTLGAHQGAGVPTYGYTRLTISGSQVQSCFVEVLPPGREEEEAGTRPDIRYCP